MANAHKTLKATELATICSAIKENRAAVADTEGAVSRLSETVQRGFAEIEEIINDHPKATDFTIPATASEWILDNDETTAYKYYYDVAVEGVTAFDVAIVTISRNSVSAAAACGLCPQNETLAGKIRIRAKSLPIESIAAEYYVCPGKEEQEVEA